MKSRRIGSNQYKKRLTPFGYIKALGFVSFWTLILAHCFTVGLNNVVVPGIKNWSLSTFQVVAFAPTVQTAYAQPVGKSVEIITPTPTQSPVRDEIQQVFGSDSPKAFKLLSCENGRLNPDAVNTAGNYPAGSRDIGIFQINEYWQKVNAKFLFNPDINIRMAYQLYKENNNSFNLWSCGRRMGI